MGFCRRCGEIVPPQTTRCKCGGSAVAPVVQWNSAVENGGGSRNPDRWAETYVLNNAERQSSSSPGVGSPKKVQCTISRSSSPDKVSQYIDTNPSPMKSTRRFPRPLNTTVPHSSLVDSGVSHHIASTTMWQPQSPSKNEAMIPFDESSGFPPEDVIASPDNETLAKAYGSILQRPETLPIHTCASCSAIFAPDATIYPDLQASVGTPRFLCRPCFASHGGSKGNCVGCDREVLTVAKEGGFVESAGKVWHKRCFRCEGCFKELGHKPMVDLFGRPSCAECFDTCLQRKGSPRSKKIPQPVNNIGGLRGRSRESSPALEELSERIGAKRPVSRDSVLSPSPICASVGDRREVMDTLSQNFSASTRIGDGTPPHKNKTTSLSYQQPIPFRVATNRQAPAIEPTTPDLSSASSDSLFSRAPSTPSTSPKQTLTPNSQESITPKANGTPTRLSIVTTSEAKCGRCTLPLFNTSGGGKIVTVPAENEEGFPASYHTSCFRCVICGKTFDREEQGHAMFVKDSKGVSHPECISLNSSPTKSRSDRLASLDMISGRSPERPSASAPPVPKSFPRFGGSDSCPGCHEPVSLMQYGVVPGPQGSRWHGNCLVCGGKGAKPPRPGCGKKLDSGAKTDRDGGVWCRECMLLLPAGTYPSPQGSPTRGRILPHNTGTSFALPETGKLLGQVTGSETGRLFGQFTGDVLGRQLTGGGLSSVRRGSVSPIRQMTRSVSPTKGLIPVTKHARPASWKHKSMDEGGRGMFLVRQMTGNGL